MSKKIVNALKAKVKELKYADLGAKGLSSKGCYDIYSGTQTYIDLDRCVDITINGQKVTNEFIKALYSKHERLLIRDESGVGNYRPFLKAVFTEMFEHAGAIVPNDLIIKELAANYNQLGYVKFLYESYSSIEDWEKTGLKLLTNCNGERTFRMDCYDPNRLKFSFSMERIPVTDTEIEYFGHFHELCNLSGSVEFKLKYKDGNVTYEDGKVLLTIPKELEDYKAGDDSLLDKLTDIINKIVEYLKKLCEKLGFKFDTKIEYNSERNVNIEHNLGRH